MRIIAVLTLFFALIGATAAEESKAPVDPAPATPAPSTTPATTPPAGASREALEQAFDGAMTCSALTAVKAQAAEAEAWRWGNRSFAFGMLAVRFYTDATKQQLKNEEVDNMLTEYANSLVAMTPEQRKPFEEGCARKYAEIDKLCEINTCPHTPAGVASPAPGVGRAAPTAPTPAQ